MAKKRGRPPYKPTEKDRGIVEGMAASGIPHLDIAKTLGIARLTLEKHYREELDVSHIKANYQVSRVAHQMAVSGLHPSMTIWWEKTRMGYREKTITEHTGKDGGPIETKTTVTNYDNLSDEQLAGLYASQLADKSKAGTRH